MFVYKVMEVLAENGGSVSFALPDSRVHAVMSIVPEGTGVLLQLMMLGEGHIIEGEAHRAENMEDMKEFLNDERNEDQVRFALRKLWNRMEGHQA